MPSRLPAETVADPLARLHAVTLALQNSEERFRCCFDEAPIGMLIIGLDGRLERVNDAFCSLVGYGEQELLGTTRAFVTHPHDRDVDDDHRAALLRGDCRSRTYEKRYIHASGRIVWVAISITLIRDVDGSPLRWIAQVQDITQRHEYERRLEYMADHDPLTGLLNRRSFERALDAHLERIERHGPSGAILMVDLDHFKYFNDSRGHCAGDALIVRVAEGFRARVPSDAVLARLGGDEFAVLLPDADEAGARDGAEALMRVVRERANPDAQGTRTWVTASVGVACFTERAGRSREECMVAADLAMYDAKERGGDRFAMYRAGSNGTAGIESRIAWAEEIEHALANDRFHLVAQPIVALGGDSPTQYELLLRMRGRDGSLIAPGAFLEVAERVGLIADIDRWVTARAIELLAEQRRLGRDLRFEINISGLTFGDEALFDIVEHGLAKTGVPSNRLVFEVTETAAVAFGERAIRFAERISQLGCSFALDDFGSGFSSFKYLKSIPFDYLKIDGEFVANCTECETDRILIAAVVQIARAMGKRTIAEFVGSEDTVATLRLLGVDYGQGYHFGKPAPLETYVAAPRGRALRGA
jgi:diguanylate cyclase (GGDEF)-like protein/PAS domain S-box-containing protein